MNRRELVLPTSITPAQVAGATLPVKIEAARRAIAECTDLPELLRYRDQAEGLAAAVRTMKHVGPELVRQANEMMADAWRKGGELLSQYSGEFTIKVGKGRGHGDSPRTKVVKDLGLKKHEAMAMVRLAKAPTDVAYAAVQKTPNVTKAGRMVPAIGNVYGSMGGSTGRAFGDAMRDVMHGPTAGCRAQGLTAIKAMARRIPLEAFSRLTPDERKVVKTKITEIMELLDEMDRLCK